MGLSVGRLSKLRPLPNSYSGAPQSLPHRPRYTARQRGRGRVGGTADGGECAHLGSAEKWEKSYNSRQDGRFFASLRRAGLTFHLFGRVKQRFGITINQICSPFFFSILTSHLVNKKFQQTLFQQRRNLGKKNKKKKIIKKKHFNAGQSLKNKHFS